MTVPPFDIVNVNDCEFETVSRQWRHFFRAIQQQDRHEKGELNTTSDYAVQFTQHASLQFVSGRIFLQKGALPQPIYLPQSGLFVSFTTMASSTHLFKLLYFTTHIQRIYIQNYTAVIFSLYLKKFPPLSFNLLHFVVSWTHSTVIHNILLTGKALFILFNQDRIRRRKQSG